MKLKSTALVHITLRVVLLLGVLPLPLTAPHAETLYKSLTPDGRVLYSDHPPAQGRVVKTMVPDATRSTALPASATEQLRKLRALFPTAAPTSGVVLYSAVWCGYCQKAKAYLASRGVAYEEIDIDTPAGLGAYAQAGGGKGVPLLLAGGQRVQGFSPAAYDEVLATKK